MDTYRWVLLCAGLLAMLGCTHQSPRLVHEPSPDPVIAQLTRGIDDLQANIAAIQRHIAELNRMPPPGDGVLQKLHALDLASWRLHQQQWQLQLDHLRFALDQIHRADTAPGIKPTLRNEWLAQQQVFTARLNELREQRHDLEGQRLSVESQLIQRYFD